MKEQFARTAMLLGEAGVERLERARVAVFGIGGVGGYVAEALARSGVGYFLLVDSDRVALSNLNRQIIATLETVGQYKTQAMKERILSINPDAQVETRECFFLPENAEEFDFTGLDYVVDAVDTVTAKLELILRARRFGVPVISSMGAGNKLDASRLEVADIYQTSVCPPCPGDAPGAEGAGSGPTEGGLFQRRGQKNRRLRPRRLRTGAAAPLPAQPLCPPEAASPLPAQPPRLTGEPELPARGGKRLPRAAGRCPGAWCLYRPQPD